MSDNERKLPNGMKLVFAPGCFDHFDGTQEELDALVKEIEDSFANGEAFEQARAIEDLDEDEIQELLSHLEDDDETPRLLQ
jgi:hypothetical protein